MTEEKVGIKKQISKMAFSKNPDVHTASQSRWSEHSSF